jgi:hypothetical protein
MEHQDRSDKRVRMVTYAQRGESQGFTLRCRGQGVVRLPNHILVGLLPSTYE